jgi:hypothetical protein
MYLELSQGKIIDPYSGSEFSDAEKAIRHCETFVMFKRNFGHILDPSDILDRKAEQQLYEMRN